MATTPPKGDDHRNGTVRDRFQSHNPETRDWAKHNAGTGRLMDQKADKEPFNGGRRT